MCRRISFSGVILAALLGSAIAQQQTKDIPIKPNKEVQSFLHALSSTNVQERQALFSSGTEEEYKQKLSELERVAGGTEALIVQLLYFRTQANGMMEAMLPVTIIEQLGIAGNDMTATLIPYLEASDQGVFKEAQEWLSGFDYNKIERTYDFGRYEKTLREKERHPPQGLVRYMYNRNPDTALRVMVRVYGSKATETELADKLKGDPKSALQSLADHPEWWARLYVAETMRKNPQLRDPAILKKLEKDDNPLVKEKVAEITSGK